MTENVRMHSHFIQYYINTILDLMKIFAKNCGRRVFSFNTQYQSLNQYSWDRSKEFHGKQLYIN